MSHPLVKQLRFARGELGRCLEGVPSEDGCRRLGAMNSISWIVGHLANQEQTYWVQMAQGKVVAPCLDDLVGFSKPASTPLLEAMWETWQAVTQAADVYLETLTTEQLQRRFQYNGQPYTYNVGTLLLRCTHHYWFHIGEAHAIRQQLGHKNLPDFVGDMSQAEYRREEWA